MLSYSALFKNSTNNNYFLFFIPNKKTIDFTHKFDEVIYFLKLLNLAIFLFGDFNVAPKKYLYFLPLRLICLENSVHNPFSDKMN